MPAPGGSGLLRRGSSSARASPLPSKPKHPVGDARQASPSSPLGGRSSRLGQPFFLVRLGLNRRRRWCAPAPAPKGLRLIDPTGLGPHSGREGVDRRRGHLVGCRPGPAHDDAAKIGASAAGRLRASAPSMHARCFDHRRSTTRSIKYPLRDPLSLPPKPKL